MRRRFSHLPLLFPLLIIFAACSAKDAVVTEPVDIHLTLDKVKSRKVYYTVTSANQDASYYVGLRYVDPKEPPMSDLQLAQAFLASERMNYDVLKENRDIHANLADLSTYKGSRSLKKSHLAYGKDYRLLLFQVNPKDLSIIGNIQGESFHTPELEILDVDFSFSIKSGKLTITPSGNDFSYYWDYESEARIYDDYLSPSNYLYSVIDMYEDFGFMNNVLSKGVTEFDLLQAPMTEGTYYLVTIAAYDPAQGEIISDYKVFEFRYENGQILTQDSL